MMKRDWEVIREILLQLEKKPADKDSLEVADFPEDKRDAVTYHVELLKEAGLIHAEVGQTAESTYFFANRLTWKGHEFLDAIRNDTIWNRTKQSFLLKGLSMTFDLVKTVAMDIAGEYLKSRMP
jgi:predicted transcriptional regulator